jgi:hypothetical protein
MKIPFDEVAALIADKLLQSMTNEELENFFYEAQYHYYTLDADSEEVEQEARDLGILGEDDEVVYPGDEV